MKTTILLLLFYLAPTNVFTASNIPSSPALPEKGVCAHRGAMVTHPENTLPAFHEAIRLGAHMIEFDVRMSKDGYLVIMHDSTVDRTTNGKGEVSQLTLKELRQLDAGIKMGEKFKGTCIPTLTEVLKIMPDNVWLNIHLKGGEEIGARVAEVILKEERQSQAFLACGGSAIRGARKIDPRIQICNMDRQQNSMDYANETIETKAQFIQLLGEGNVLPSVIFKLRKHGIHINYYRADTPEILCKLFDAGVNFPLVNDLEPMIKAAYEKMGIIPLKPHYREK